ncbi:hypothetical protein D3C79_957470 [compost metagenome]
MSDGAFTHIGDDFHVAVWMRWEPAAGGDQVVVPYPQVAPVHTRRVMVFGKREMVVGVEPAVVGVAKAFERSQLQHDRAP